MADTGYKFPTANTAIGGGGWSQPTNAYADDGNNTAGIGDADITDWESFNPGVPAGVTIDGIEVIVGDYSGTVGMYVDLAVWNGTSWGWKSTTTGDGTKTLGGSTDKWGLTWDVSGANGIKIRVDNHGINNSLVDYFNVKIYYTIPPPPEYDGAVTTTLTPKQTSKTTKLLGSGITLSSQKTFNLIKKTTLSLGGQLSRELMFPYTIVLDTCDVSTGWTLANGSTITVDSVDKQEGVASLKFNKTSTTSSNCSIRKDITTTGIPANFTVKFWLFIEDQDTLDVINRVQFLVGNDTSNYWNKNFTGLSIGWNALVATSPTVVGNPDMTGTDYIRVYVHTNNATDLIGTDKVGIDFFRAESDISMKLLDNCDVNTGWVTYGGENPPIVDTASKQENKSSLKFDKTADGWAFVSCTKTITSVDLSAWNQHVVKVWVYIGNQATFDLIPYIDILYGNDSSNYYYQRFLTGVLSVGWQELTIDKASMVGSVDNATIDFAKIYFFTNNATDLIAANMVGFDFMRAIEYVPNATLSLLANKIFGAEKFLQAAITLQSQKAVGRILTSVITLTASLNTLKTFFRTMSTSISLAAISSFVFYRLARVEISLQASDSVVIRKTFSTTVALIGSLTKTLAKILSATITLTALFFNAANFLFTGSVTLVLGAIKSSNILTKLLQATTTLTGSIQRGLTRAINVLITLSGAKIIGRIFNATVTLGSTLFFTLARTLKATITLTPTIIKSVPGYVLSAGITLGGGLTKAIQKVAKATISLSDSTGQAITALFEATLTLSALRGFGKVINATITLTSSRLMALTRSIGVVISLVPKIIKSPTKDAMAVSITLSALRGFGKVISNTLTLTPNVIKGVARVMGVTLTLQGVKTFGRLLGATITLTGGVIKAFSGRVFSATINLTASVTKLCSKIFSVTIFLTDNTIQNIEVLLQSTITLTAQRLHSLEILLQSTIILSANAIKSFTKKVIELSVVLSSWMSTSIGTIMSVGITLSAKVLKSISKLSIATITLTIARTWVLNALRIIPNIISFKVDPKPKVSHFEQDKKPKIFK